MSIIVLDIQVFTNLFLQSERNGAFRNINTKSNLSLPLPQILGECSLSQRKNIFLFSYKTMIDRHEF